MIDMTCGISKMKALSRILGFVFLAFTLASEADETYRTLKVKDEVYTNVTVTSSTATDIYFSHARGMASAKLKDLDPEIQKHFHYDAAKSAEIENARRQATANYRPPLPQPRPPAQTRDPAPVGDDFVAPDLHARSIRGQPAPTFQIEKWLTDPPSVQGKFVLIDFWATWCRPCRQSIPELNGFYVKFKDRLAIVGISDESEADIRKMTVPHIDYAIASDTQRRMNGILEIKGIPHCILIDPSGIVRYEGHPGYLDDEKLEHSLDKYSR